MRVGGLLWAIGLMGGVAACAPGAGVDLPDGPGPWPEAPAVDYSAKYNLGRVQSVGVDAAHQLWLLDGARIGVLRPGDSAPRWTSHVGQASKGFGPEGLALGSTVICGGAANRAYVGYRADDLKQVRRESPDDPEFLKGDLDVVTVNSEGTISLETHLGKTTSTSGYDRLGIRNTNDWHYDEDRSVLACVRVTRGPHRGELYIGTNHGVTRIKDLTYNSHRHPTWDLNGSLRVGYSHALGIAQNGDVLIGNEWKVGIVSPPPNLEDWDDVGVAPFRLNTHAEPLNSLAEMDSWRAFVQTIDGAYWLGSATFGLWRMDLTQSQSSASFTKLKGLPSEEIETLAATDDGALLIGTRAHGLWRREAGGALARVAEVPGDRVLQLVEDPTVKPAMLFVLTSAGLTVLRR